MREYLPYIIYLQSIINATLILLALFIIIKKFILFTRKDENAKIVFFIVSVGILLRLRFVYHSFINPDLRGYKYIEQSINIFNINNNVFWPLKGNVPYIIYNFLFRMFKIDENVIFYFNSVLCTFLAIPFYLFVKDILNTKIALYSAFLFVIFPTYMRVSASEEFTIIFLLFTFLSLLSFFNFIMKRKERYLYYFILFVTLLIQTRPDGIFTFLIFIPLSLLIFSKAPLLLKENYRIIMNAFILFIFMNILFLFILCFEQFVEFNGHRFINTNILVFLDLFKNPQFNTLINFNITPFFYIVFFLVGVLYLILQMNMNKKPVLFLLISLLLNIFLYFSGWTLDMNDAIRYQSNFLYLFLIFCGIGLWRIMEIFNKKIKVKYSQLFILLLVIFLNLFISRGFLMAKYNHNIEHDFFKAHIRKIPNRYTIIMFQPLNETGDVTSNFPLYLLRYYGNNNKVIGLGGFLKSNSTYGNFIFYKELVYYQFFATEFISKVKMIEMMNKTNRNIMYKIVNSVRKNYKNKLKSYIRPEYLLIKKEFRLETIFEKKFVNNSYSWQFTPAKNITIGFYKIMKKNSLKHQ